MSEITKCFHIHNWCIFLSGVIKTLNVCHTENDFVVNSAEMIYYCWYVVVGNVFHSVFQWFITVDMWLLVICVSVVSWPHGWEWLVATTDSHQMSKPDGQTGTRKILEQLSI